MRESFSMAVLTGRAGCSVLLLLILLRVGAAGAQDLEPRQYSNIPIGFNFLAAGYADSNGSVLADPSIALENASIDVGSSFVGFARGLALGNLSGKVDASLARSCLSGSADYQGQHYSRNVCGLGDARVRLSVNFIGAPALPLQEFAQYRQNVIVGASVQLSAPTGDYDPDRLVNIGTNRWAIKAEIGASKVMRKWILEGALAGSFYQANNDFFGGNTREQDPIYSLQGHLVRGFGRGAWVAIDTTYFHGGQTVTNGTLNQNLQANSRFGLTVSVPINRKQSIKFNASSGLSTRTGSDFDTLGVAWQYRWGKGR
jgi:hypothetical protein